MATRKQNERQFDSFVELLHGGRLYQRIVRGRRGWTALYFKEVDAGEVTLRFWQEIRDEDGVLREVHVKYPTDEGHRRL